VEFVEQTDMTDKREKHFSGYTSHCSRSHMIGRGQHGSCLKGHTQDHVQHDYW
jgi:hypothetical protein